jgi:hypothetical protein
MWLFTPTGFLSIVVDRDEPGRLLVRARARADLDAFCARTGSGPVLETPDRDYRFRVCVTADVVADDVAAQARAIDYGNFKAAVAERQGRERADVYERVWSVMHAFQFSLSERLAARRPLTQDRPS